MQLRKIIKSLRELLPALILADCLGLSCSLVSQVTKAHLVSLKVGWALGDSHLYFTTTNGSYWSDITPPHANGESISDVQFTDRSTGYVSLLSPRMAGGSDDTDNDVVLTTTEDGGQTWNRIKIPHEQISSMKNCCFKVSLDFINAKEGWMMARLAGGTNFSFGSLLATKDGGKTWTALPPPPIGETPNFIDGRSGWLSGGPAGTELWRTTDGGISWHSVVVTNLAEMCGADCRPNYSQPAFSDPRHGVLTVTLIRENGSSVEDFTTDDGGLSWALSLKPSGSQATSAAHDSIPLSSGSLKVTVASNGTIDLESHGKHQSAKSPFASSASDGALSIAFSGFANELEGWLLYSTRVCAEPYQGVSRICPLTTELLNTSDGGRSYQPISPVSAKQQRQTEVPQGSITSMNWALTRSI